MPLCNNLINLLNQSFFKTEEKPAKYMEWLESEYTNGKWYICEEILLTFLFTGRELTQYSSGSFSGSNMFIDYGDGTIETTTGKFGHVYDENGTYTVKIYDITSLGDSCFKSCTGLTSINIPNSVSSLESACFLSCTDLTSIEIPLSVTSLGSNCFRNCTSLTSIEIPSSVTSLGASCFGYCTNLTSIEIPSSVTNLGVNCFERCNSLTSITLNWQTSSTILTYQINWVNDISSWQTLKFYIPQGTTEYYIQAGYPSSKLVEHD